MAERKKRSTQRTESSATGRRAAETKKKKRNAGPILAAVVLLIAVVFVAKAAAGSGTADNTADGNNAHLSGQPEFFSTVGPESLTNVEVDVVDDPVKAAAFFENGLFVGDTQMEYIQNAKITNTRAGEFLSKALFLTAEEYSWQALEQEFSGGALTFNLYGDYVTLADALKKTNVKKVFLQIGRTDLSDGDVTGALQHAENAILRLKQACPQTELIVLSLTPSTAASAVVPGNNTIRFFNDGLRDFCVQSGIRYADTASAFPEDGLPQEYCADAQADGIYLNADGTLLWIEALLESLSVPQSTPAPTTEPTPKAEIPSGNSDQTENSEMNVAGRKITAQAS